MASASISDSASDFLKPVTCCPICQNRRIYYAFAVEQSRVVRCNNCGFIFSNPQPTDAVLTRIHDKPPAGDPGLSSPDTTEVLKSEAAIGYLDHVDQWLTDRSREISLLELGCGEGNLLVEAERRGYRVTGIEHSLRAAAHAQARLQKGRVLHGELADQSLPDESFDVCVLVDAIERLRDPRATLRMLWQKLRPNGLIFIATPSRESWTARLMGSYWTESKTERLSYFNRRTLETLLWQVGFENLSATPGGKYVSLDYVAAHFKKYPVPIWTPLIVTADRLTPASWRRAPLKIAGSELLNVARKGVRHERPLVSIVVPVYNERATVTELLAHLDAKQLHGTDKEIIIVESNSSDGSREVVRMYENRPGFTVILEDRPRGKGAATRAGITAAHGDIVMIQDADLEYDMDDYDALLEPILQGRQAFVLGARHGGAFWKMRQFRSAYGASIVMNLAHWAFTWMINVCFFVNLRDPFTMYKIFRRDCVTGLKFQCNRFDFDWELLILLVRRGYRPIEIPVNYRSRSFSEGKKSALSAIR